MLLFSVTSIYLIFELPQRESGYLFNPQTIFVSKLDFSLLSDPSTLNHGALTSDFCLHILLFLLSYYHCASGSSLLLLWN